MMAVEEEKNVVELKKALELFNANAERLYTTHEALRKRVQELTVEAQNLRSRLENVLASTTDAVIVLDKSLTITLANNAAKMMGLMEGKVIAHNTLGWGKVEEPIIAEAMTGKSIRAREAMTIVNGEKKVFSISAAPFIDAETGMLTGIVMSFRDVTEFHRLRTDLERKERLAVLGEMAAAIAHEVRNPLGGLRLYAGLADDSLENRNVHSAMEHLSAIKSGIDEIDATIENVLTFARDMDARFAPTSLRTVVEEAIGLLNGTFLERGTAFECCIPEDVSVNVDARLLRRAIANLIDNAVKIQPQGGSVEVWHEISGEGENRALAIIVGDRGPGVKPEEAKGWFEPFRTGRAEGTGLGLAIVERIADAHGGAAELRLRKGGGAEAVIYLPAELIVKETT